MPPFNPKPLCTRLERLWSTPAEMGKERGANHVYLNEIVSDRYALVSGFQVLRDELQLMNGQSGLPFAACGADLSVPSVLTTLAYTNCGDRIHQGEAANYRRVVASRFATMSELGDVKLESFSPTGGGTDDGATLAHVTVAHQADRPLRMRLYDGNPASFVLVGIDLKTHVGRLDNDHEVHFGTTQESPWREPRAACGAIVGTLTHFNADNAVHRRLREDLGEDNFEFLVTKGVSTTEGVDITAVVAAAIVAIQGMMSTAEALKRELDERGIGHLTASTTVNRVSAPDPIIYLARATVFGKNIRFQGFGTDARQYGGKLVAHEGDRRLTLSYNGMEAYGFPVAEVSPRTS